MAFKKIITAFLLAVAVSGLCLTASVKEKERLALEYHDGSVNFYHYGIGAWSLLCARPGGSLWRVRLLATTGKNMVIAGALKAGGKEYAVITMENEIRLYTPDGSLADCYKTEETAEHVISCCIDDIDRDLEDELFIITGNSPDFYGDRLIVLSYDKAFFIRLERTFKELNPWKIQTADIDGDGAREISLGVYKTAYFHPVMAKRPFLYRWSGDDIVPLWRGSRLSRPFEDYVFCDIDHDGAEELAAIELLSDGRKLVNTYRWKGFGFESLAESDAYEDVTGIEKRREELYIEVKMEGRYRWIRLEYEHNRMMEGEE